MPKRPSSTMPFYHHIHLLSRQPTAFGLNYWLCSLVLQLDIACHPPPSRWTRTSQGTNFSDVLRLGERKAAVFLAGTVGMTSSYITIKARRGQT